jgi:putative toxin-antitoxin system antitoxin component (TIGR02293 family)
MPKVGSLTIDPVPAEKNPGTPWLHALQAEADLHERALQLLQEDLLSDKGTAKVFLQAQGIWQDSHSALEWLAKPHPELNDEIPATLLKSPQGLQRVQNLLGAIEYGFPV